MRRQIDLPRSIEIGGNIWTVHFYRKPPLAEKPGEEIFGACVPKRRRLYVKQGQAPLERLSTLIHELLHAIEYEYKIEIPHSLVNALEGPLAESVLAFSRARSRRKGRPRIR